MLDQFTVDRRALLQNLALLLGASALPAAALAAPKRRARRFLAAPQYALLGAVADTIMPATDTPGAIAAQVPARLDGLLRNWASAQTRSDVSGALGRIDAAARAQKKKGFLSLTPAERAAVLRPHDAAALKPVPPPANAPKANFFMQTVHVADPGYHRIKDLVLQLYYFSEVASTTELIYEHVPGKFEPSIKLTPQSRPYLGTGPF
jgi:gluconate 2-dehydrogenase gamma chain